MKDGVVKKSDMREEAKFLANKVRVTGSRSQGHRVKVTGSRSQGHRVRSTGPGPHPGADSSGLVQSPTTRG